MNDKLATYAAVKNLFMELMQDGSLRCEIFFRENQDRKYLHLKAKCAGEAIDYYYGLTEFCIHRFINDGNEVLISKKPEIFTSIIKRNIDELINKTEVI